MAALALGLRARLGGALARVGSTVVWVLQPPSVKRAFADRTALWGNVHTDLAGRKRRTESEDALAWRSAVLMAAHFTFASSGAIFLALVPLAPMLRLVFIVTLAWLVLSAVVLRVGVLSYNTIRECNALAIVVVFVVTMVLRMHTAERIADVPNDADRYLLMIADRPPSVIVMVLWIFCSTWQRFLVSLALVSATFAYLAPIIPLNSAHWDSVVVLFVSGVSTFAGLVGLQWTTKSLLDEVRERRSVCSR